MPMPPRKKSSSKSEGAGEKERFEVLLEENNSKINLVLEAVGDLRKEIEALRYRLEKMEQKWDLFQSAILSNSNDIQGLRRDVRALTERFDEHLKAHATS